MIRYRPSHAWQMWTPAFKVSDLNFFVHQMAMEHSAITAAMWRVAPGFPSAGDIPAFDYTSARQARLVLPNGVLLSLVTMIPHDPRFKPLHGDPRMPDYEVMATGHALRAPRKDDLPTIFDEPIYNCRPSQVHDVIAGLLTLPVEVDPGPPEEHEPRVLLDAFHQPDVHGSFLYCDPHIVDPTLQANRVAVSLDLWQKTLIEQEKDGSGYTGALCTINRWCANNCTNAYAWTCGYPSWVFASHRDATLFRVIWG